ncbi:MAG: uroporphyrinogen-III synthase [Cyclobacteriaceae bacterium]
MKILLTKTLPQEQLDLIKSWGWSYDVVETLKITSVDVKKIPEKTQAWIVSSRNSFEVIKKFITEAPQHIYCVGDWMKKEIEKLDGKISVLSFENMKSLASDLAKQNFQSVIYFCGVNHRPELEEGLKNSTTKIFKVVTHKSEMTFPKLKINYDAIFIFSPRSGESLLKHNQFSSQTLFACIGPTTNDYLNSKGLTNTFVSSTPDSKTLLEEFHHTLNLKF